LKAPIHRRDLVHLVSMKLRILIPLVVLGASVCAAMWHFQPLAAETVAAPAAVNRKILFFTKSSGFEHDVISWKKGRPSFAEKQLLEMGAKRGWEFTFSKDGSLFSAEYLKGFHAVLFFTSGDLTSPGTDKQPPMSAMGKQALLDWVKAGGAFVGTHAACDTFHTDNESKKGPDRYVNHGEKADDYVKMIGAEFIRHGVQQVAKSTVINPNFPGMENLGESFEVHEEWYSLKDFRDDLHVLLVQETSAMKGFEYDRPPYPSTWARNEGKGRVFYTSMGHREDIWTNPIFQNILGGGVAWAMGDAQADIPANIKQVTPGAWTNPAYVEEKPKPATAVKLTGPAVKP
jgi:uncharacterized protein